MAEKLSNLGKEANIQNQEAPESSKMNQSKESHANTHYNQDVKR